MTCSSCKYLKEDKKYEGTLCDTKYYCKNKKELLEPIIFKLYKFVDLKVEDIICGNDVQLNSAIEDIKKL